VYQSAPFQNKQNKLNAGGRLALSNAGKQNHQGKSSQPAAVLDANLVASGK